MMNEWELENLIHTYGLEKRFNIKTVYPVESIMDKLGSNGRI